ncbi:hypothetical protein AMECASPLE_011407 [Ameca splendens]|uniref:Uncharacterized protein n=1 Tax=Ameca splendens TaxID=208324 RepID=A0ABV1A9Q7_9TELE
MIVYVVYFSGSCGSNTWTNRRPWTDFVSSLPANCDHPDTAHTRIVGLGYLWRDDPLGILALLLYPVLPRFL